MATEVLVAANVMAGDMGGELTVASPRQDGILAADLNERRDVVGFQWVGDAELPGINSQEPFFAREEMMTDLPLLDGYTPTLPAALSDDGLVVGRSSRPVQPGRHLPLQSQAFAWDAQAEIRGLGVADGDTASFACGLSRDGRRTSGCTIGDGQIRACLWKRDGYSRKAVAMPHESRLGSYVVAISGDGAASRGEGEAVPRRLSVLGGDRGADPRAEAGRWAAAMPVSRRAGIRAVGRLGHHGPQPGEDRGGGAGLRGGRRGPMSEGWGPRVAETQATIVK